MIAIAGQQVPTEQVTFNERVFAKSAIAAEKMELTAPYQPFAASFAPIYEAAIADLRADDAIMGKFSPPYAGATDYPSLEELFLLPQDARMEMIGAFFALDILRLFFPENSASAQWTVRSLANVARNGDVITLSANIDRL